jgi:hypothetical protein
LQFISTTRRLEVALQWANEGQRTVAIDLDMIDGVYHDLSTAEYATEAGLRGRAYSRAVSSAEVLIEGYVPPDAIRLVS